MVGGRSVRFDDPSFDASTSSGRAGAARSYEASVSPSGIDSSTSSPRRVRLSEQSARRSLRAVVVSFGRAGWANTTQNRFVPIARFFLWHWTTILTPLCAVLVWVHLCTGDRPCRITERDFPLERRRAAEEEFEVVLPSMRHYSWAWIGVTYGMSAGFFWAVG